MIILKYNSIVTLECDFLYLWMKMCFPNIYLMWRGGHCCHINPAGPVAWQWSVYISASTAEPVSLGVPYRPLYTPAEPVTPMTGSEVGGSLARLGGLPDPPGEGEDRQDGLAAWGVQVGRMKASCST